MLSVIEDVVTSPENDSPTEPKKSPTTSDIDFNDEPMELPQSQEDPENDASQEKESPNIVESSLEPVPVAKKSIEETQDVTHVTIPDTQDAETTLQHSQPLPMKVLTAQETFAVMLPSEKEKLRRMILDETQSQELMDTLETRKENTLSNKSLSELVDEIKLRSCSPEVYKILASSDPEFQSFVGNNADLAQLLQNRSEDEILAAMVSFYKNNEQTAESLLNKLLGQLDSKQLAKILSNLEDKVCEALPKSTLQEKIKNDSTLCKEILDSTETADIVENLSARCSKGGVSFTPVQARTIYSHIKTQVVDADSIGEIFDKLQMKIDYGGNVEVMAHFQSRPLLRKFALDSSKQEEILTQLTLDTQDQQMKLSAKLSNDDLLAMATTKLLSQQNLNITTKMLRSLEKLALYLPNNSLIPLIKCKILDVETKRKAVQALTENVDLAGLLNEQQLTSLVEGLMENPEERCKMAAGVVRKSQDGELLEAVGGDKLVAMMTLGVMNGDVVAIDSIQKIYCNSDTMAAACQILKDGANDSQITMVKEAISKQILASWVSDIILK